ncbi:MAG: hypothetical protein IKF91_01185 [Bacilli bacterium]|nr:hypothetical protein [Bacilli bacterium]
MDKISIKCIDEKYFIFFDNEYGKRLDSYLKGGWLRFDFYKRTNGIISSEFLDYIISIFNNIHITHSMIKSDYYDFSNELQSIIYKFNSINFDIESVIKDHGHEDEYFINKREVIENYFNNCTNNLDGISLTGLIELVNKLYMFQVKVFKTRDLFKLKDDLMSNLKDSCPIEVYVHYNELYNSYLNEDVLNLEKLENLFLEIQSIILDDWKINLSSIDNYRLGNDFRFVCHSVANSNWHGDYLGNYVSASLLTNKHINTYNRPFGFIMNPDDIIMTSSEDLFIRNNSDTLDNIYLSGVLPTVQSFKNVDDNTLYYNEVVLDGFDPIGIFCITDGSKELNPYYLDALKLKENFPNLPIVDLDVSFFASDIDTILYRDALVDAIEEEMGIYNGGGSNYYDYFSYFWDDFMSLKKSDYSCDDIIGLFNKYYNLLDIDLDELFNSTFDDDFILKLIKANNRYNSINNIFNSNFNADDIIIFYEIYSNLSDSSYNRLNNLFPNFNTLLNLLEEYFTSNGYDFDSFNILGKFKNYDDLISYLNEFYGNNYLELDNKKYLH